MVLLGEFYQKFKGEVTSIVLKCFPKIGLKGTFPNTFYKVSFTLISESQKDTTRK